MPNSWHPTLTGKRGTCQEGIVKMIQKREHRPVSSKCLFHTLRLGQIKFFCIAGLACFSDMNPLDKFGLIFVAHTLVHEGLEEVLDGRVEINFIKRNIVLHN
jgi:hypothetical protein